MLRGNGPPAWHQRKQHRADSIVLQNPLQQSIMAFHETKPNGATQSHYVQLFGDCVGTTQVVLAGNLTTVSFCFCQATIKKPAVVYRDIDSGVTVMAGSKLGIFKGHGGSLTLWDRSYLSRGRARRLVVVPRDPVRCEWLS